jgi:uncharacterized protein
MQHRPFGRLSLKPSALGMGAMRLPLVPGSTEVDETAAIEMLRFGIDSGIDYIDTAYPYHGGSSERAIGRALRDGYRDRVTLATKMPIWLAETADDLDRIFGEQLQRLETGRVDLYMLHSLHAASWEKALELDALAWLERQQDAGRIGAIGFSFHDSYEVFETIVDDYGGWEFCQIQYNYVYEDVQAGTRGLELAASRGLAVVVMEPLFGGTLANPPEPVRRVFEEAGADPIDLALRWLWDKPEVSVVLSGMGSLEQVKHNADIASRAEVGGLTDGDRETIARAKAAYRELSPVPCTACRYCLPCPSGVAIPRMLELYNSGSVLGAGPLGLNRVLYSMVPEGERASACTACRECEAKCPQGIEISEWMPRVHQTMTG